MPRPALFPLVFALLLTSLSALAQTDADKTGTLPTAGRVATLIDAARQLPARNPEKERLYREALALAPAHPQVLFNLALVLQANGKYTQAIPLYRQVLKQNPADAMAHYNLANVLLALDDPATWQRSAWHFRQFLFYGKDDEHADKARASLDALESNLATRYSAYRDKHYSKIQLIDKLTRIEPAETVRGNSRYDGPRIPLMLKFAVQSADLTPAAKQQLDDIAAALKVPALHNDRIQIEGYTDSHEHPEFEQRLHYARLRAERVRQYLQRVHKLPAERFTIRAFADLEIISANNTPEGRAANRRVELYNLSKGRKLPAPLYDE